MKYGRESVPGPTWAEVIIRMEELRREYERIYSGPFCERCKLHEVKETIAAGAVVVRLCSLCLSLWRMFEAAIKEADARGVLHEVGARLPSGAYWVPSLTVSAWARANRWRWA